MLEIIGESVIKRIIDIAADALEKKIGLGRTGSIRVDTKEARTAVEHHLSMVSRWAVEISFRDLRKSKRLMDHFEDLDLTLGPIPTRKHISMSRPLKVTDLLHYTGNIVILGDPGAGKTTSLKRLALDAFKLVSRSQESRTPILIRLRDLSESSVLATILSTLGVSIHFDEELSKEPISKETKDATTLRVIGQCLRNLNAIVLVDGLDEVPLKDRRGIVKDLRDLILHSKGYQVVVTCRVADFVYNFENSTTLAIEPLSTEQIRSFATKWLGQKEGEDLLQKINSTPYGGSEVLPLTLAHLCAIYERSGTVPEKPRTVYRKIVRLLLEEWDEQRSIRRESRYASFDIDRKEDFLKALALRLTLISSGSSFTPADLKQAYYDIYDQFGLPKAEVKKVIQEIESHSGLIIETGFEAYEFAHKSIQEYLSAEYILKLPRLPRELTLRLPNEMALAVALSSDSNEYFIAVTESVINRGQGILEDFTYPFVRRILIEKVDFRLSIRLGYAILSLYSETYYQSTGQLRLPFEHGRDAFSDLFKQEVILDSAKLIMQRCQVKAEVGETSIIIPPEEDKPLLKSLLPVTGYYTVDGRYFELIGQNNAPVS